MNPKGTMGRLVKREGDSKVSKLAYLYKSKEANTDTTFKA